MRRRGAILVGSGSLATLALSAVPLFAEPMTLPQAQYLALKRSPEMGQAQARAGAAEATKDQVEREWLPKITGDAAVGWRHLRNDTRVNLGFSAVNEKPLYATISLDQAIWDFGRRNAEIRTQKANLDAARNVEQAAGEDVALAVARAYLQAMVQERIVAAAESNLSFHEALTLDVAEGVKRGAMSISERQQAEERLQSAKVSVAQGRNDLAAARTELALFVGSEDFELRLPDSPGAALPGTLEDAQAAALANDPRINVMEARLKAAGFAADRARTERLPTVGFRGTARSGEDFDGFRGDSREYQVLFQMRWPIWDGGVTNARVRQADYSEDDARFALAKTQRDSELQVRKGWVNLETWRSKLTEQQARLVVANLVLDSYRAQFGIGRRSLLDLLDAQNSVYSATVDTEIARFGTLLAEYSILAQLNRLRGHFGVTTPKVDPRMYGPR